ncbi:MAG: SAM-dependent methyltransferase [Parachlamydiaceae bacterium]|nr:SAM-dependent methyltransferase [Parachlamydiaceae bacterium]
MENKKKAALLLLPNLLGEMRHHQPFLPASVDRAILEMDGLIAESASAGRRYLSRFETLKPTDEMPIALYNEHSSDSDIDFLLEPLQKGERWGFLSDAGLPCIADPGSKLVRRARLLGINIQAFVGPSSILLSLMQSGLPAQKFFFHGYLDRDSTKRSAEIRRLEIQSKAEEATQIFIEAPYRNMHLMESLLQTLSEETTLCVAWELTTPDQGILSQTIKLWKKSPPPNLAKKNAIFLFHSS